MCHIGKLISPAAEVVFVLSFLQVVEILIASLVLEATPVPRKIARLHLVSDILHNSAASLPNAWAYRAALETRLPAVFDHLGDIYLSFPGRMKAEQFKMQVINVRSIHS